MLPLFGGAIIVILVIVLGIAGASSLLVERARLYSLADGAALYASENFDPAVVSRNNAQPRAPLNSARVRESALAFLRRVPANNLDSVFLESATTPDGWHAEVTLSSLWSPPVVSDFLPSALRIRVEARAQTFLR